MAVEKNPGSGKKIAPDAIYGRVGDPVIKFELLAPVFGDELVRAVMNEVRSGAVRTGTLKRTVLSDPPQVFEASFANPSGASDLEISLTGDWQEGTEVPRGLPILARFNGRVYRKTRPDDNEPIAQEGDYLPPEGAYAVGMFGKLPPFHLRLPKEAFPKGGTVTKFVAADGADVVQDETIICYIEKVE